MSSVYIHTCNLSLYYLNKYKMNSDVYRNRNKLSLPKQRLYPCQNGIYRIGIKLFNKLPNKVKCFGSRTNFRKLVISLPLSNMIYKMKNFRFKYYIQINLFFFTFTFIIDLFLYWYIILRCLNFYLLLAT